MRLFALLAAVIALALAGCADAQVPGTPTSPSPAPALPPIEITRSGGFAGVHESLSIDSDGRWRSDEGSGQLSAAALSRLAAILADPALRSEVGAALPDQCCDMFQYELRAGAATYRFGEPDLGPLLTELLGLLQDQTGF